MKTTINKRKITVQLWTPLLDKLNTLISETCLNRDAYLDVVFANEAAMLLSELKDKKNSPPARAFIKQCFAELKDLHPVSFTLTSKTADALTEACDQVNVWRDVFVNRVIYFLVANPAHIENQLGFKFKDHTQAIFKEGWEIKSYLLGPRLAAIGEFIADDPFIAIRTALRSEYPDSDGALHAQPLGRPAGENVTERSLAGFSAYINDEHVPGTKKNTELSLHL